MNEELSTNPALLAWVNTVAQHALPQRIKWCDGTKLERAELVQSMLSARQLIELEPAQHPRSFLYRTDEHDAAPDEQLTFISAHKRVDAGPTNRWLSPEEAQSIVWPLFRGAMRGRTLYVVPYLLGPPNSRFCRAGVQLTDSPYIALTLGTMARVGLIALDVLDNSLDFARAVHSQGDLSPERRFVVHFPDIADAWSIGSVNWGNALLSSGSQGLRLASVRAHEEGWLAEHMSILAITNPEGRAHYVAAAIADGSAGEELALDESSLRGWTVKRVTRDACWMRPESDGQLWAVSPELGVSGNIAALGTQDRNQLWGASTSDVILTNVALRAGQRPWWEELGPLHADEFVEDWRGQAWSPSGARGRAAHAQARYAFVPRSVSGKAGRVHSPRGVPISGIILCGRQARSSPLVCEARSWRQGVYFGATLNREADGDQHLVHDPMAMLGSCGYNMGDYLSHWLAIGRKLQAPPKVFGVNWFRRDVNGRRLWPGGAENIRILKWIFERMDGTAFAQSAAVGLIPDLESLDLQGLDLPPDRLAQLFANNQAALLRQAERTISFLGIFGDCLPSALLAEHRSLVRRLQESLH
jgi:phosphoenolpyruvate carboxykinase (GTP)